MRTLLARTALTISLAATAAANAQVPSGAPAASAAAPSGAALREARQRFQRGLRLYDTHDYEGALAEFVRAYDLSHRSSVLFNLSATYRALHRYPEAVDALRRFVAQPGVTRRQRATATRALGELESLLAHVHLEVTPAEATLLLDGNAARVGDVAVGPGTHLVEASREGFLPAHVDVVVASGETRTVSLTLDPVPPPPSPAPASSPPPPPSRLAFRGIPRGSQVRIDGETIAPDAEISLSPGIHEVSITSPDRRTWRGPVVVEAGTRPTLDVRLAPRPGLSPVAFGLTTTGTVLLTAGAIACGVLAIQTHDDFQMRTRDDPQAAVLAERGRALAIAADSLGVAAVAAGSIAVFLLTRTEFVPTTSRARIVFAPHSNGAWAGLTLAF